MLWADVHSQTSIVRATVSELTVPVPTLEAVRLSRLAHHADRGSGLPSWEKGYLRHMEGERLRNIPGWCAELVGDYDMGEPVLDRQNMAEAWQAA